MSSSRFYKRLALFAVIMLIAVAAVLFFVNFKAKSYQKAYDLEHQQEVVEVTDPDEVFKTFVASADADFWTDFWLEKHPGTLDSRETVSAKIVELFSDPGTAYYRALDFSAEAPVYVIKSNHHTIARVYLTPNASNSWDISNTELYVEGSCSGNITVPDDCTVCCNGVKLDESYVSEADANVFPSEFYADKCANPVKYKTFSVEGLLTEPEFTVETPAGKELYKDIEGTYLYVYKDYEDLDYILKKPSQFFEALTKFFVQGSVNTDGNAAEAMRYSVTGSPIHTYIDDIFHGVFLSRFYEEYDLDYSFSPVIQFSDDYMGLDVAFTLHALAKDGSVLDNSGTYRLLIVDKEYGWFPADFTLLASSEPITAENAG